MSSGKTRIKRDAEGRCVTQKSTTKLKGGKDGKDEKGRFTTGNTFGSSNVNIVINPRKQNKGKEKIDDDETQHRINSTYREMDEPCPECGGIQIECTRGDGHVRYWCTTIECAYLKPIYPRERL